MENIIQKNVVDLYTDHSIVYGTEVNRRRMLPDVRDGLKLVQRRDLYVMSYICPTSRVKTARVVGEVLKYHPHGDSSVADSIKMLVNWFDTKVPLAASKSNFGSMQGDGAAATRYTEVSLSPFGYDTLVSEMKATKDIVDWLPTFDYSSEEPEYLPAKVPLLLINGALGIGFGIKCGIPPHNLGEVIDATINLMHNPNDPVLLIPDQCMPCEIIDTNWKKICNSGNGNYICRGIIKEEEYSPEYLKHEFGLSTAVVDPHVLVIKSTPDGVSFSNKYDSCIQVKIENLAKDGKLPQIYDIIDKSHNDKMNIVILLRKGSNPSYVRDIIYKNTEMQKSFHVNFHVLEGVELKRFSYKSYLEYFLMFRKLSKFRYYNIKLQNVDTKLHEKETYIKLLESGEIDNVINMMKSQKTTNDNEIIEYLIKKIKITDIQAKFIINSNIKTLSVAYLEKYKKEVKELKALEAQYINMITDENLLMAEIERELLDIKARYNTPRKCKVIKLSEVNDIPEGIFKVIITEDNYIKKINPDEVDTNKNSIPKFAFKVSNTENLLLFTEHGRVYKLPVYKIPNTAKNSIGYDLSSIVKGLTSNVVGVIFESIAKETSRKTNKYFLTVVTKNNYIKNIDLDDIVNAPPSGIIYTRLNDNDIVKAVEIIPQKCDVIIYSGKKALRIPCRSINHYKRNAIGVLAMNTKADIDGITPIYPDADCIVVVTDTGKVNKIPLSTLPVSERGKSGNNVINLGKSDSILKVLGSNDKEFLRVITTVQTLDIPVSDIKNGSSLSTGQKIIPTRGAKVLNCYTKK